MYNRMTAKACAATSPFYVDAVYRPNLRASKFDQAAAAIVRTINRVNEIYAVDITRTRSLLVVR
jgi:hypothetical protein